MNLRQSWLKELGTPSDGSVEASSVQWLSKHVRTYGKMFRRLQQLDKNRFVNLPNCTPLVLYYWNQVVLSTQAPASSVQGKLVFVFRLSNTSHSICQIHLWRCIQSDFWFKPWFYFRTVYLHGHPSPRRVYRTQLVCDMMMHSHLR